ncbi:hypothetical protein C8N46_10719 [Kordia periserrulae]|uniref:Uncharacterized protein n=1 Tax=Kordia periserrulae TaxID=701523 RepID=A0A2T6BVC9_9FLAO|nr:hypothetical protein [Kordia periserrulae]PTX60013.1 hypothetical protein C8N46_10719 [Kordia periserrulae]
MMKKQKLNLNSLRLKKVSIATLNLIKGADEQQAMDETLKTYCCSQFPYCIHTLTTRPDSLNPGDDENGEGSK